MEELFDDNNDEETYARSVKLCSQLHAACSHGDLEKVKKLIEQDGAVAWFQSGSIGWTALHYAADGGAGEIVKYLLRNGAVWNIVDNAGFTAADIAFSRNDDVIFNTIVMEGVRAEMVKAILAGQDNDDIDDDGIARDEDDAEGKEQERVFSEAKDKCIDSPNSDIDEMENTQEAHPSTAENNEAFLKSRLRFETDVNGQERCIDEEGNGVMMGWELPIMKETARLLVGSRASRSNEAARETPVVEEAEVEGEEGLAVLNVGFGLGLVDVELQKYKPTRHVIIEPHPDVLAHARQKGWYDKPGVHFFEGTWREYIAAYEAGNELAEFDAIYFDTFSEHYADLHSFFSELPNLLRDDSSLFSFFHGLGATSMTFYEVYTHVSEMHLNEIGLKTTWTEVDMNATEKGETTWEGIARRYWNLPCSYRLPICHLEF